MAKVKTKRKRASADAKVTVLVVPPPDSKAHDRFYRDLLRYGAIGLSSPH